MSYGDYLALGETKHHEYYDGLTVVSPPSRGHVLAGARLARLLEAPVPGGYEILPGFGWQPAEQTVFVPEILVAPIESPGPDLLLVAPLLVVEVTSPSTRGEDLGRKMRACADGGAVWYWIADPEAVTLTVYRNDGAQFVPFAGGGVDRALELSEPFPITLDLAAVFA